MYFCRKKSYSNLILSLFAGLLLVSNFAIADPIKKGDTVKLDYKLSLTNGTVISSSKGNKPMTVVIGSGQPFPLVNQQLIGLNVNDDKEIILMPQQAFGAVNPANFKTVDVKTVPEHARKVGAQLVAQGKNGKEIQGIVQEIKGDKILLNFNHPLAGRALKFNAHILSVEKK